MKKLIFCSLFLFLFFLFLPTVSHAQTTKATYPLNTNPNVPQNFHTYTQNVFIEILSTATCFIGGTDLLNPSEKCLGIDPLTKKIGYTQDGKGLAQVLGGLIGSTYNIPISSSQYGHDLAAHFGITRTSYALQPSDPGGSSNASGFGTGIGFVGLSPVINIWKSFRNLTYLLFVFIFVVMGLGIMFRINIDARTVMTIQNQIPKIIIGLVLITLSYAIAGFLIDMMYVGIYLVIHIFDSQGLTTITTIDTNPVMAIGPLGGINGIAGPAASGVGGVISSLFSGSIGNVIGLIVGTLIGQFIGGGTSIPFGGIVGGALGGLIGLFGGSKLLGLIATGIAYLIISIAVLSALFRVWFMLIKAYIFIFLDVIFAPFWILGGILPGAPGGAGPWIRSLLANLSAFPTVIVLFMIGRTIQEQASNVGGNFIPPLIGNPGANSGEAIGSLIGLGIILIMPEAVTITKSTLKAPELKYTAAIGRAVGVGQGVVGKPIGAIKGEYFGKDAYGQPKEGSRWLGERLGRAGQILSGGGIKQKDAEGKTVNGPWFKASGLISRRGKSLEESRVKRILGFGKKEKDWRGRTTAEGKDYQAKKAADEALRKDPNFKYDATKHDKHMIGGQTFYTPKEKPEEDDDNNGNPPSSPAVPPRGPQPPAGNPATSPEVATDHTPNDNVATTASETASKQQIEDAAEGGAFRGARSGIGRSDIDDSVANGVERAKREDEGNHGPNENEEGSSK